jgi:bifunctional UDP-N-acetylglucosamine pyrophosphorylase / glucosamine-1-phosphate N-acetyltransferase
MSTPSKVEQLIRKGVNLPNPQSVEIADDIEVDRIASQGVTIHSGCKLFGRQTFIAQGAQIGFEGPVTIRNCFIGPHVALKGGFFEEAVFLEKASCGSGAHLRAGTILEEQASIAHTVGLKQTILFPFVTLGSLINFCDCLMAGGTGPHNHSEVGSSYIHFNFTPDQDKATASLIGDVPRGVMLNQSPIFLGGQGGLVGPCRIAFGTVVAAGSICRKDQLKENQLIIAGSVPNARMPFTPGVYRGLKRILSQNFGYIGNLMALGQWYQWVRSRFVGATFPQPLMDGLTITLQKGIAERIKQLDRLKEKVQATSMEISDLHTSFCRHWPQIQTAFQSLQEYEGELESKERFLTGIDQGIAQHGPSYLTVIKALDPPTAQLGTQWLQGIVEHLTAQLFSILSSDRS